MFCHVPCHLISPYCPLWFLFIWLATPPSFQSFLSGLKYHSHLLHSYGLLSFLLQQYPTTVVMLTCWDRYKTELRTAMGIPPQDHDVYAWCKIFLKQMDSLTGKKARCQILWRKGFHMQEPESCNNKSLHHSNLIQNCTTAVHKHNLRQTATNSDEHIFSRTVSLSIYTSQNILFIFAYENLFLHLFLWYLYSHRSALKFPNQYFCLNNIFIFYSWVATRIATVHNFISYQV